MARAIGIDLGTTNSCAAVIENGIPRVITTPDGEKTIPSVFAINAKGRHLVGEEARQQAVKNPQNTVIASKRLIGRTFGSKSIQKMAQVFTYEIMGGNSSEVLVRVAGKVFTLEQISAAILARIKQYAEVNLGEPVDQAVITVPAYFNDRQRQAVRAAGELAGLQVLRVLNEPTAAALAYGLGRVLNQRVAIYDLGGGTFDISVIDIKDKVFEVIATGGDTFLGGVDFDDRVMQHLLKHFLVEYDIDLSYDRTAITRIRIAAEAAKIALSTDLSSTIHLPAITEDENGKPLDLTLELTRPLLEGLTDDLVQRSIETCDRILREAGSSSDQIDEMLLVGGQSRMPRVRQELQDFLGRPPSDKVHPDEAVAIGAAIMSQSLSNKNGPSDVQLLDVLPMAIGINKVDGTMHVLFPKNQPLPSDRSLTLTTSKDGQKSIMLRIYQGDHKAVAQNELLGSFVFTGLRQAARGQVKIEVAFHIDAEGILDLTAKDLDTNEVIDAQLRLDQPESSPPAAPPPKKPAPKDMTSSSTTSEPAPTPPKNLPPKPLAVSIGLLARLSGWLRGLFGRS
jgi:molecular chaperone DnaK